MPGYDTSQLRCMYDNTRLSAILAVCQARGLRIMRRRDLVNLTINHPNLQSELHPGVKAETWAKLRHLVLTADRSMG